MANENKRMLCDFFNMAGFRIIMKQNRKFSKNDKAAITPNMARLALTSLLSYFAGGLVNSEMFRISKNLLPSIFDNFFEKLTKMKILLSPFQNHEINMSRIFLQ